MLIIKIINPSTVFLNVLMLFEIVEYEYIL
jgi:hypothetical protein